MERQSLSQEEINALIKDCDNIRKAAELTPLQKDALGEIGNIGYGTAATALSELLNQRVLIDTPCVFVANQQELKNEYPIPFVMIEVDYKTGLTGSNVLFIKANDAAIIVDLIMGGNGTNPKNDLGQMELSAVAEVMSQMIGNTATAISALLSKLVAVAPPRVKLVDFRQTDTLLVQASEPSEELAVISFRLKIGKLIDSMLMLVIPVQFAVEMANLLTGNIETLPNIEQAEDIEQQVEPEFDPLPIITKRNFEPESELSLQPQVTMQPAKFATLGDKNIKPTGNIGLILDVPLQISVELGSTRMKIREILELGLGSVVELDKLVGDPVNIYVNGKLIAKGEVVVADDKFGIKIKDIISPIERAHTLQ